ncbi:MAG: FecR domain-containing protein [Deltaproteobacteria bacterium]|nr:FecR domain-containing protein [Deltaproteobacteria bacterium]
MRGRIASIRIVVLACLALVSFIAIHRVWADGNRGGGVSEEALPGDLRGRAIMDGFVPSPLPEVGVIHGLEGHVVVVHKGTGEAYFGREGDPLHEKDTLTTLQDSRCRIKFTNEDVVTMAPETRFGVETHDYRKAEGRTRSVFSLLKGKAMFYALRLFRYRENRVTLNTPTAVVGVRGTKFGAEVTWIEEKKISGAGVRVAGLGGRMGAYLAQIGAETGQGRSFTNCFSEDGVLDVNGKLVRPGEMFRGDTGRVIPTPPEYVKTFEAQTEVRKEEKGPAKGMGPEGKGEPKGEKKDKQGEETQTSSPLMPSLGTAEGIEPLPVAENLVNIINQEGPRRIEQEAEQGLDPFPEGKLAGQGSFVAGMMVKSNMNGMAFNDANRDPMFFSVSPNLLAGGQEKHVAFENAHLGDVNYKMEVQEIDAGMNMEVQYFTLNHGSNKALVPPHFFAYHGVGSYVDSSGHKYMEWGYWADTASASIGLVGKDPSATSPDDKFYAAKGMIWHVEGDLTHPDYIDYLQRQNTMFNYSGNAVGVFASSSTSQVHILGGNFDCQVHFGSRQVSNFNIDTSEAGNYRVNLVGGSGPINSNGTFEINGSSFGAGSTINGNAIAGETGARGAFFGPKAEGVGGTWNAHDGSNHWATGEFHGQR